MFEKKLTMMIVFQEMRSPTQHAHDRAAHEGKRRVLQAFGSVFKQVSKVKRTASDEIVSWRRRIF